MPVIRCDCGRQLRAADEYVGRRVKCPACGDALLVQAEDPPGDDMVSFACECGKKMQTKASFAGRSVKCPECGDRVEVPGGRRRDLDDYEPARKKAGPSFTVRQRPAEPDEDEQPARSRDRDDRDDRDDRPVRSWDRDEEEPRPRRSKRGRRGRKGGATALIVGSTVGILALVGVVVAMMYFWGGGAAASAELNAAVPGDAAGFATVRVANALASPLGKELLANLPLEANQSLTQMEQRIGLGLKDVDRVTVVLRNLPLGPNGPIPGMTPDMWVVVNLNKAADANKIRAAAPGPVQEAEHGGKKYHLSPNLGLFFPTDRTVVFAPPGSITKAIDQYTKPKTDGPMASTIKRAGSEQLALGFELPPALMANIPRNPGNGIDLGPLTEARRVYVGSSCNGNVVNSEIAVTFPDATKAAAAKEIVVGLKGMLAGFLPLMGNAEEARKAKETLDALTIAQRGNEVSLTGRGLFDANEFRQGFQQALRGGMPGANPFPNPQPPPFPPVPPPPFPRR